MITRIQNGIDIIRFNFGCDVKPPEDDRKIERTENVNFSRSELESGDSAEEWEYKGKGSQGIHPCRVILSQIVYLCII